MVSVTQRIKAVKQPRGGYINPRTLDVVQRDDGLTLHTDENIHASLTGAVVDYLSRVAGGTLPGDAFKVSLAGASILDAAGVPALERAKMALAALTPGELPDDESVTAACELASYDVALRAGPGMYNPDSKTAPNEATIENIQTMVSRASSFFAEYGPVTLDGFVFPGGYTDVVDSGDGDFLTADTLWDFKVSVNGPTKDHTLQVLMYWIMGMESAQSEFTSITHLGLFNPRLNNVYRISISDIPPDTIRAVEVEVIGYL